MYRISSLIFPASYRLVNVDRLNRRTYILMNENPLLLRTQGFKPRAGDILLGHDEGRIGDEDVDLVVIPLIP